MKILEVVNVVSTWVDVEVCEKLRHLSVTWPKEQLVVEVTQLTCRTIDVNIREGNEIEKGKIFFLTFLSYIFL